MMETLNVTHHARIGCDEDAISNRKLEIGRGKSFASSTSSGGGRKILKTAL